MLQARKGYEAANFAGMPLTDYALFTRIFKQQTAEVLNRQPQVSNRGGITLVSANVLLDRRILSIFDAAASPQRRQVKRVFKYYIKF